MRCEGSQLVTQQSLYGRTGYFCGFPFRLGKWYSDDQ
jgi:hypothetical protein